jgi:predicted esterase
MSCFQSSEHHEIGNENAENVVIFLHGSGGGHGELAYDFEQMINDEFFVNTKFIFPAAKSRRYTMFGGENLPVWFDRTSISQECLEDMEGLTWTVSSVRTLARTLKEKGAKKLFIAGFSQGGCAALYCGYKFLGAFDDDDMLFQGVVCMSSFLCDSALAKVPVHSAVYPPLCFTSNRNDNVVPEHLCERTLQILKDSNSLEITHKIHCGSGGHWLNRDCVPMLSSFINSLL